MKNILFASLVICLFVFAAAAQKLLKPTKIPTPATAAQNTLIQEGVKLHDAKNFDAAIEKYNQVLTENPDCTVAMHELALSLYSKGDKVKAMETAYRGSAYISENLSLFYNMMANCLDDVGKPDDAIKVYREAEDILKYYPEMKKHLGMVYYNLGITYFKQKKYLESRTELKKAVETDSTYASASYLLMVIFNGTKYPVPSFLTAARFLSLELNSDRSRSAAKVIADVLKPAEKDPKTGNINIFINMGGPKDEGDYTMYDLILGTLTTAMDDKDKKKTDDELFIKGVDTLIDILDEDKNLKSSFIGKNYVPFVAEMKKKSFSEVFSYIVLYINGKEAAGTWLKANDTKLGQFMDWAKAYK